METRLQLVPDWHDDTEGLAATAGPTDTGGLGGMARSDGTAEGGNPVGLSGIDEDGGAVVLDGSDEHSEVAGADCDYAGSRIPFVVSADLQRGRARGESCGKYRGEPRENLYGASCGERRGSRSGGRWARLVHDERGAVTAEYAIVIMAAVAFAGLLVAILRSSEIRAMLVQLVEDALGAAG